MVLVEKRSSWSVLYLSWCLSLLNYRGRVYFTLQTTRRPSINLIVNIVLSMMCFHRPLEKICALFVVILLSVWFVHGSVLAIHVEYSTVECAKGKHESAHSLAGRGHGLHTRPNFFVLSKMGRDICTLERPVQFGVHILVLVPKEQLSSSSCARQHQRWQRATQPAVQSAPSSPARLLSSSPVCCHEVVKTTFISATFLKLRRNHSPLMHPHNYAAVVKAI